MAVTWAQRTLEAAGTLTTEDPTSHLIKHFKIHLLYTATIFFCKHLKYYFGLEIICP